MVQGSQIFSFVKRMCERTEDLILIRLAFNWVNQNCFVEYRMFKKQIPHGYEDNQIYIWGSQRINMLSKDIYQKYWNISIKNMFIT